MKNLNILLIKSVLLVLILFGLWTSLHYTFYSWGPNSDVSYPAMLWQGIHRYGLIFLKSANPTPDNWLFSLIPIFFALFSIFGVNAYVLILVGWLIYAVSAMLTGIIVKKVTNNSLLSLIAVVLSLFVGVYDYSASWMVYSDTHNISMLWTLASLLITIQIFSKQAKSKIKIVYFVLIFVITFIAGFSDPWFNAAFNLPMILALLLIYFQDKEQRQNSKIVISLIVLSWLISYTRLFGLLSFIPRSQFVFISSLHEFIRHFLLYFDLLGRLFNIKQAFDINLILGIVFLVLSMFILVYILTKLVFFVKNKLIQFSILEKVAIYFSLFSIMVVSTAFLLYNFYLPREFPWGFYTSRYMLNNFYFLVILMLISMNKIYFHEKDKILKMLTSIYIPIYIFIGVFVDHQAWKNPKIKIKSLGVENLISTLEANHLYFGYGDYWASQANAINVLTNGKITVVGIKDSFSPPFQASSIYFNPNDIPKEPYYFLVVPNKPYSVQHLPLKESLENAKIFLTSKNHKIKFSGWHLSLKESLEKAKIFFGKPTKIITLRNRTIIVWDHKLDFNNMKDRLFSALFNTAEKFLSDGGDSSKLLPQYLEENGYLPKSFGYETGPAINWTKNDGWIGQGCPDGKGKCFGVGVVGKIDQVKPIIDKYKSQALKIFFPYPKLYNPNSSQGKGQLLMIFRDPEPKTNKDKQNYK